MACAGSTTQVAEAEVVPSASREERLYLQKVDAEMERQTEHMELQM